MKCFVLVLAAASFMPALAGEIPNPNYKGPGWYAVEKATEPKSPSLMAEDQYDRLIFGPYESKEVCVAERDRRNAIYQRYPCVYYASDPKAYELSDSDLPF